MIEPEKYWCGHINQSDYSMRSVDMHLSLHEKENIEKQDGIYEREYCHDRMVYKETKFRLLQDESPQ
jgi:hypothetical protein